MSSTSQPFGLRPAFSLTGVVRPIAYTIASAYGANILQNQPVKLNNGVLEAAAIGDRFIGTFQGVEFTDSDGRRRVSNKWTSGTVATEIVAYATLDPSIVYEIQASGPIAIADIGAQADFTTITAGSTVTGLSAITLNASSLAGTNAGLRIIDIAPGPDNVAGDAFTIVQVQIAEHQNVADVAAY
jgi:hypothetical protein